MDKANFIFLDKKGRRWFWCRLFALVSSFLFFLLSVFFIRALLVQPKLKTLGQINDISKSIRALSLPDVDYIPEHPPAWLEDKNKVIPSPEKEPIASKNTVSLAWTVAWDKNSLKSFEINIEHITHVSPEWFSVSGLPPSLESNPNEEVKEIADKNNVALMPMLTNFSDNKWNPETVEALIRMDVQNQHVFFKKLAKKLLELKATGVIIDFEQIDPEYKAGFTYLLQSAKDILSHKGLELWLCIPVGNDIKLYDLDALSSTVDRFVAMLYDENGEDDSAGPIASLEWFSEWLNVLTEHGQAQQWIIGLGNYGYDWGNNRTAETVSFNDVMARASASGEGQIISQAPFDGSALAYTENGEQHTVWFLDAISFHNQKKLVDEKSLGGIAIWRLGLEDNDIWKMFDCSDLCATKNFEGLQAGSNFSNIGDGDFLTAKNEFAEGQRSITEETSGFWSAKYINYPKSPVLYHQGDNNIKQVAITFDDGPDQEWTPIILNILKAKNVKATFFVTGANALEEPSLIQRILKEGHLIGNHTYSHANLSTISAARMRIELNATQRIVENITGYSTVLFRPPYNADRQPETYAEFKTILSAQEAGYLPVSASIDPTDWKASSADEIIKKVKEQRNYGNVLLLHDAGGDRTLTVEALPAIIDYLQMRGDEIVSLNSLLKLPISDMISSIGTDETGSSRIVAGTGFTALYWLEELLWAFIILSTVLILVRTAIIVILTIIHVTQEKRPVSKSSNLNRDVSVLLAAYNEAKVVNSTISSLLQSSHNGKLEIIVVDDGSTDGTANEVEKITKSVKRVHLIRQSNQGKAKALQVALLNASYDTIVTLDADTQFNADTISNLLAKMDDPSVGAVAGHACVGNQQSFLARMQSLEYICGFNLDRRAYDIWGCITVIPGAVSAFSRDALLKVGGFSSDTLAEDTDLTLELHKHNYKIRFAPKAYAWTEAPETIRTLIKQRTRWAFGTLQCLWKHRDLLFSPDYPALGFFSLPSIWFCHILIVAVMPIVDLLLILSLIQGHGMAIVGYAVLFLLVDFLLVVVGCVVGKERLASSLLIIPMRFLYRPILCIAVWRSIIRAMRGAWVGWGKLERKGFSNDNVYKLGAASGYYK